jgi:anti-sigma regulatory factor (Ser/Thr protein kinase)
VIMSVPQVVADGPEHEALVYQSDAEASVGMIAFISEALRKHQPVLVELPGDKGAAVRDALGLAAGEVEFRDMAVEGRNPASIIPGVLHRFAREHPGQRPAIVVESMWSGRSAAAYTACVEHEALTNLAFVGQQVDILCRFDLRDLPAGALQDIIRTHPLIRSGDSSEENERYEDPMSVLESIGALQPSTPRGAHALHFTEAAQARHFVQEWGAARALTPDRMTDVLIAVSEVAGNSVAYAGGSGTLLCWQTNGSLVYEVRDSGRIPDVLAGRIPPAWDAESGRGLLMANLLCDLLQVSSGRSGTVVRMWIAAGD